MERVLFCLAQSVKGVIVYIMAKQNRWQALAGKIPVIHWPLLDLNGLTEIFSYCSKNWVELHSAMFVWVYYLFLFDLINISLSLSYGVYS